MKVVLNATQPGPKLHWPLDLKPGTVYTWGSKACSYLRVTGGSVILGENYPVLSEATHSHFSQCGSQTAPFVEIATDVTLNLSYEV